MQQVTQGYKRSTRDLHMAAPEGGKVKVKIGAHAIAAHGIGAHLRHGSPLTCGG